MKIACSGAGPAGLYLAILMKLRDANHDVTVFERNPEGVTYGWGVVFWDGLLRQLHDSDPESARAVEERSFRWSGQVIDVRGKQRVREEGHGYGIARQQLLDVLVQRATDLGVDIRFDREIGQVAQLGDADLVVAADGANSTLRRLRADEFETEVAVGRNKYVWLGTSKVFEVFTFGFAETDAGWIWFHAYAFDTHTSTVIVECSPETWRGLGLDTLGADESLRLLETIFAEQLDGHPLIGKARDGEGLPWLAFQRVTNRRWHAGNVVLVGDAAHTTHFSIGSGTRLGIEDAIGLARQLHGLNEVQAALAVYEKERRRAIARPQRDARLSAQWFESVSRHAGLEPRQLFELLRRRRSRFLPHLPPRTYYQLHQATGAPRRWLRRSLGSNVKALYRR